jgi:transcriptional regulator with XRE-family HTH domain
MVTATERDGLGARLRMLRRAAGLSLDGLAAASRVTVSNIAQIERGKIGDPRLSTLLALSRALGTSLGNLVGETDGSAGGVP